MGNIKKIDIKSILALILMQLTLINCELTPPYFNLATGRKIWASATCGVDSNGPELYCKLVGANTENEFNKFNNYSVIQGQVCDYCDPLNPEKNHAPEYAIDGTESWWQSPPLSRGMKYNEVNLTIDFGQEFHVAYLFIRMGNSPRPGLWTLEKSSDYGKTWKAWQHFSDTPTDCETYFGRDTYKPISADDDVICTTEYSKIVPLENGEIPVNLLKDRPSANNYFNSTALQEWTRATNVRIQLLRTKNLLGHLMSVQRQDPTVTRRYFYSIKDISIGGRCMCNGHADTCDVLDPRAAVRVLACRCQHRTCGIQCNECCTGYEQKKWRQNTNAAPFKCEPCNCHGHSTNCEYNEETDRLGLSLDIHGNYEGGGVCKHCQHNTQGINCNKCIPKYYRPYGKYWNETDVCRACDCEYFYSTGNCDEETGRCECRPAFQPPNCDSCAYGYFDYPNCRECECNLNGTYGYHCEAVDGSCPCKVNFNGTYCKECAKGYYAYPECKVCECSPLGSPNNKCDSESGQCQCTSNFGGHNCDQCKDGYYSFPTCSYCDCDIKGTEAEICNKDSGKCLCREGFGGPRCDQCLSGFYNYPDCVPCNCSILGSRSTACDLTGKCSCLSNFGGKQCNSCSAGNYNYPECLPCNCDYHGSEGITCNTEGQCLCNNNFDGKTCNICKEGFYNFPACEECNCDPAGVIARFGGCGSAGIPIGELCECKPRVTGRICNHCKPLYWNLNISNPEGCELCDCHLDGTIGALDTCNANGQCTCKPSVSSRTCKECKDGAFDLDGASLFGCKDCDCDIGGSRNSQCDKITGQCNCHPRVTGRNCTQPLTTHYFPTLYQFQYEYEDGYTPSGAHVRYQYDDELFPEFSGKGYAVFSGIQNKVINDVSVFKSSVYRMVIRYVNPTDEDIVAKILIQSDNPTETDQTTYVLFKPSKLPQFITVSGSKGDKPSPIVLDPGRYSITTETSKNVMLDYFVLLPAAYYEASILTKKIENPCEIGYLDLCRHYKYPNVDEFKPGYHPYSDSKIESFDDFDHLKIINHDGETPILSAIQLNLKYRITVPHTGRYVIVIDYITHKESDETYYVNVQLDDGVSDYGRATMYACLYTMPCRQPVLDEESREKLFLINATDLKPIEIYQDNEDVGSIGIISVTAIPVEQWTINYIKPSPVCVIQNGECATTKFRSAPDSKKIEFEYDHEYRVAKKNPPYAILDESIKLIYLDNTNSTISIHSKVSEPGRYVILIKYYQPNYPTYSIPIRLDTDKQAYDAKFEVNHCPSSSGCRSLIKPEGPAASWFDIDDGFTFTLTNNQMKGVWLDHFLIVPINQYESDLLKEDTFDQTQEFINKCGQNHFYVPLNASEFCKKAVFSLTADYNHGALPCNCNYDGSTSFECDPYGGQCQCRENIIGKNCDACRTGFYGFPDCKPCDCPATALCEKNTGECICPPHVTGVYCDQCKPYTYGFHQIIGCEECNCNRMGVEYGNLQCDLHNGSCVCASNIEGRACDQCVNGHYRFPHCDECNCNPAGTEFEVCDKDNGRCFCKKNVVGQNCNHCVDGTYNLQKDNPDGCTSCFCFGKTQRCDAAYLKSFNVSLLDNISLNDAFDTGNSIEFEPWGVSLDEIKVNETTLEADFSLKESSADELVYFGVLSYFGNQNNHLTSYGGYLTYTLYYTTGLFAKSLVGHDIILEGKSNKLFHTSYQQPANFQHFYGSIPMVESNFQTYDGKPVTRGDFMMVLRDLKKIYIRANYWDQTVISQLSDVVLTMADYDETNYDYKELPVEKCHCPLGYQGLSCEDCAPGYYRDPDGPNGGYCLPCQCNGHAETCDCNTGICKNCMHGTHGDHCELCIEGYHGNATFGAPGDCMICACPLPIDSNNFATTCEISPSGHEIYCECKRGYTGPRCEYCAPGFYGDPEKRNEFCRPCECSGNINPEEIGSCDTTSGECLKCLNNTFGAACNLCAPGYYGDAINLKDCKTCDCDDLGTLSCDAYVGTCVCHPNVIGSRCDRCEPDHYGFDSGYGCRPCDCGVASNSSQCDDHTGQCPCKPGVTGATCDRCGTDYWNYTQDGCTACKCNKGYSRGFGCNRNTGQCECLPGVVGEKCDRCPHRWVLNKDIGCSECDACHHALLDVTDAMRADLAPVVSEFKAIELAYFTGQKLNYFDNLTNTLRPEVEALDPNGVNLNPSRNDIEKLVAEMNTLVKKRSNAMETAVDSATDCQKLAEDAKEVLNQARLVNMNARNTIHSIDKLADSFDVSASLKADNAISEATHILGELNSADIDLDHSNQKLKEAEMLIDEIKSVLAVPVKHQEEALGGLKADMIIYRAKLNNLTKWSEEANAQSLETMELNRRNKLDFDNSKFDTVANQAKETTKNIDETNKLIINGNLTLDTIERNLKNLYGTLDELKMGTTHVDEMLPRVADEIKKIKYLVDEAQRRAANLTFTASDLSSLYHDRTADAERAYKAATAYSDIVTAVIQAGKASKNAIYAVGNATELSEGIEDKAGESDKKASELLSDAQKSLANVQNDLQPHLAQSSGNVKGISDLNTETEKKLDAINVAREQLPNHSQRNIWEKAHEDAIEAHTDAQGALEMLAPIIKLIPKDLATAKNMSKDVDITEKEIAQIENYVDRVKDVVPQLKDLIDHLTTKQEATEKSGKELGDNIDKLKRQIEMAREIANNIKVGVEFAPTTVLELKPPETLPLMATQSRVSAYFNTTNPNGFLMYLGNENKPDSLQYNKNEDFMALEIENGYPVLTIDLGDGSEKIINNKYVADGKWYQVIVDRTGSNVKLNIKEELENGLVRLYDHEVPLHGSSNVFNVDKNSRLFVGGYSADFIPPDDLKYSSFEGQIEELKIGEEEVGLWNFIDAQDNARGAKERNVLRSQETPSTGYRFNGNGYVILDARPYQFKQKSSIHFKFKASRDSSDGLMFYAGRDRHYISVELQNGGIYFQYNLGERSIRIGTEGDFNDDEWHSVEAERLGSKGQLKIDGRPLYSEEGPTRELQLQIAQEMYIGGVPSEVISPEIVQSNFDGCIDNVLISGTLVDLSQHTKAYGVRSGCPQKFSTSLSYRPHKFGYLKHNINITDRGFQINLKFRTRQHKGIIFYATNYDQSSGIGLTIDEGNLHLINTKSKYSDYTHVAVTSSGKRYNDGEWHVVSAVHLGNRLKLLIDDIGEYVKEDAPELNIQHGDIYFGGLPKNYRPVRGALSNLAYFTGCINDVTLNGQIVNFATSTDKQSGSFENCPADVLDYDPSTVKLYYIGDEFYPQITSDKHNQIDGLFRPIPNEYEPTEPIEIFTSKPNYESFTTKPATKPAIMPPENTATTTTTVPPRTKVTTKKPRTRKPTPPSEKEHECKLPIDPDYDVDFNDGGYRFIGGKERRIEINSIPVKHNLRKHFNISLKFRTEEPNAFIFYASNSSSKYYDHIALYLTKGKVKYQFRAEHSFTIITTEAEYNDNEWHTVEFSRHPDRAVLVVDGVPLEEPLSDSSPGAMYLQYPFYVGGIDPAHDIQAFNDTNLQPTDYFTGCIRDITFSKKRLQTQPKTINIVPCSDQNERGLFFGKDGGYVKLFDHFLVGSELTITFDFKPRVRNGILFSVHGKAAWLILELVNGSLVFSVRNDEDNIIEAEFVPAPGVNFCDGQWRTVHAIKSQYVITLTVDGISSAPAIGNATKSVTETIRALYMGGHPIMHKVRGVKNRKVYHGCIRNVKIRDEVIKSYSKSQIKNDVWAGMCPIN